MGHLTGEAFRVIKLNRHRKKNILKLVNPLKLNIDWNKEFSYPPLSEILPISKT